MMAIHLRGLAERADCAEQPLGPDVIVPEKVPVLLEFSAIGGPVGTATLNRDDHGIWADAIIRLDAGTQAGLLVRKAVERGDFRKMWPSFAIDVARTVITKDDTHPMGVITGGQVMHLSLCRANRDPDLPPYEIVYDDLS